MRVLPLITAVLVCAALYMLVFERDRVTALAAGDQTAAAPPATATPTEPPPATDTEGAPISVVVAGSKARAIDNAVLARGQTSAARQVEVRAETTGLVVSEPLRRGAYVTAGQLLCSIDPGTRPAQLTEAEARLEEARARLPESEARLTGAQAALREAEINDRAAARLSEGGFASETRVAGAQAGMESARAAVESARAGLTAAAAGIRAAEAAVETVQLDLARLSIRAPFDGLLETDTAELGTLLQPGSPCATVIQLDPIKLVGFVSEVDVEKVEVGAMAGARLVSGREMAGRVTFLSRSADPMTRTFRVEVTVPNADLSIRDGQTAEIVIAADGRMAHLLPASALTLDDDGRLGVRIVDGESRARFVTVTLLRDVPEGVWLSGLPEEATVILIGQEFVSDGVLVTPVAREVQP
jgi:multidrug efflux system membrane fusion protein